MTSDNYDPRTGEVLDEPREQTMVRVPPSPPQPAPRDLMAILGQRDKLMDRLLDYAIKSTHHEHWFDMNGKPWPTGPACEVMARRCGVSVVNVTKKKRVSSDELGEFYIFDIHGTFRLPSGYDELETFGTCSSRDNFLGTETKAKRALSEIDEGNIMKAAYTNMLVNGITRLLGVRNLSWERLYGLGIKQGELGKVEFEAGAKGGGQKAEGAEIVIKFGKGKDKTIAQQTDENLTYYLKRAEEELGQPDKSKFKKYNEKVVAAIREEQAKRANAKAGITAKPPVGSTIWQRVEQILIAASMKDEKGRREFVKSVTKKTSPSQLVEADIAVVQEALEIIKREKQNAEAF